METKKYIKGDTIISLNKQKEISLYQTEKNGDIKYTVEITVKEDFFTEEKAQKKYNKYKWGRYETIQEKGAPEDKNKLCIFYDMDGYYIDTYNNLSSSEQKNIKQWCYLPLITDELL